MEIETQDVDWILFPVDLLLRVFSFLKPVQLFGAAEVCKTWELYSNSNELWRPICNKLEVNVFSELEDGKDWSFPEMYQNWYSKFKCCLNVYPQMKSLVNQFSTFSKENNINFQLKGVDAKVVTNVDAALRTVLKGVLFAEDELVLPEDLVCWYLMCSSNQPIMGCYSFYDHDVKLSLVPLQFIASAAQRVQSHKNLIPFCISPGESKIIFVVVKDFLTFRRGNIVTSYSNSPSKLIEIASSFSAWMHDHVKNCLSSCYSIQENCINLFPRINVPEAVTRGVVIQASPLFIPEACHNQQNLWSYSITISMPENESNVNRCKLVSRYWQITVNGRTQVTQGPGVIGLNPDVYPGSFFRYESCCPINALTGTMGGHFTMKRQDGELFDAIVPTMTFVIPSPISEPENF
jgi:ApaG protein